MWRVVCIGSGPRNQPRRVVDKGPLHPDRHRANAFADRLRATGLYQSVRVEGSTVEPAVIASAEPRGGAATGRTLAVKDSLDDLSFAVETQDLPLDANPGPLATS